MSQKRPYESPQNITSLNANCNTATRDDFLVDNNATVVESPNMCTKLVTNSKRTKHKQSRQQPSLFQHAEPNPHVHNRVIVSSLKDTSCWILLGNLPRGSVTEPVIRHLLCIFGKIVCVDFLRPPRTLISMEYPFAVQAMVCFSDHLVAEQAVKYLHNFRTSTTNPTLQACVASSALEAQFSSLIQKQKTVAKPIISTTSFTLPDNTKDHTLKTKISQENEKYRNDVSAVSLITATAHCLPSIPLLNLINTASPPVLLPPPSYLSLAMNLQRKQTIITKLLKNKEAITSLWDQFIRDMIGKYTELYKIGIMTQYSEDLPSYLTFSVSLHTGEEMMNNSGTLPLSSSTGMPSGISADFMTAAQDLDFEFTKYETSRFREYLNAAIPIRETSESLIRILYSTTISSLDYLATSLLSQKKSLEASKLESLNSDSFDIQHSTSIFTNQPHLGMAQMHINGENIRGNCDNNVKRYQGMTASAPNRTTPSKSIIICNVGYLHELADPTVFCGESKERTSAATDSLNTHMPSSVSNPSPFIEHCNVELSSAGPFLREKAKQLDIVTDLISRQIHRILTLMLVPACIYISKIPIYAQSSDTRGTSCSSLIASVSTTKTETFGTLKKSSMFTNFFDYIRDLDDEKIKKNEIEVESLYKRHMRFENITKDIVLYYRTLENANEALVLQGVKSSVGFGLSSIEQFRQVDCIQSSEMKPEWKLPSNETNQKTETRQLRRKADRNTPIFDVSRAPVQFCYDFASIEQACLVMTLLDQLWFGGRFLTVYFQ